MSTRMILPRTQFAVLAALLVLTVATVGISFLHIAGHWHLTLGLTFAAAKATLVVLFFMHVIHSPAATRAVIVVSVFWLTVVLIGLTMTDYLARGSIELMPGH